MTLVEIPDRPFECKNLVADEWKDAASSERREVLSPYTGKPVATVPLSSATDVAAAARAGREAAEQWRRVPIKERTQALFRYRELALRDLDELASWVSLESGKTFAESRAGVLKGLEVTELALSLQNLDDGGALEVSRGVTCETRREPLGVVAGITPFNFPAMVPMWMFPIAITVGNAFILKASEKVPVTACRMGELMLEAGFPPGVFQLVHGQREAVEAIVDHDDVAAIGFVGSTPVAKQVYARATSHGKRALA
ncbi:MAG: aldehyde dehydrogenase family protein, partial [Polyangiales bacterium]